MQLTPRQLDAFRSVMLSGSMTSAARLMRVSQPAISRLIRDLETDLRLKLFERSGNRVVPSQEAIIIFNEVTRFYTGMDRIMKVAEEVRQSRLGQLRVASFNALSMSFMSDVITSFLANRSDVSIYLETESSRMVLELVALQHFDIGIAQISGEYPNVSIHPLPLLAAECVVPEGHPLAAAESVTAADLEGLNFIALGKGSPLRMQIDAALAGAGVTVHRQIETSLAASACDLVAKKLGVSIIDPFTIEFYGNKGIVRKPFTPFIPYEGAIIRPIGKPVTLIVDQFLKTLQSRFEQ